MTERYRVMRLDEVEWNRAIDVLEAQLVEDPGNANVLYDLACAESHGGYHDAALGHLALSIEREPSFATLARDDADLDAIRADDQFPASPA